MSKIKNYIAGFRKKLKKEETDERKKKEAWERLKRQSEECEKKQENILKKAGAVLSWLANNNEDFSFYFEKIGRESKYRNVLVIFERKFGTHKEPIFGDGDECHGRSISESRGSGYKELESTYSILLFLTTFSDLDKTSARADKWDLQIDIQRNMNQRGFYLFPNPIRKDFVVPAAVSEEMISILNQLSDPESAIRFFEENHDRIMKLNSIN